jgi:putative heme-binding domain-containing protein
LKNVPKDKFAWYNAISGDSIVGRSGIGLAGSVQQPKGPGNEWQVDTAMVLVKDGLSHRDFQRGKSMFIASMCGACHTMRGEGGTVGPDLTQLGSRFSYKDMLESIIEPSKTISDQFAATEFFLHDGGTVVGRLMNQDADNYYISQNPFAPQTLRPVPKKDVIRTRLSQISIMSPGLINRLNGEELKDLLAYLKAGGNKQDSIFVKK